MARARSGGGGWVAATVILGIGFVISLVVMIIVLVQIGAAQDLAQEATKDLDVFVDRRERTDGDIVDAVANAKIDRGKSVVRYLIDENRELKGIISSSDSTLSGIKLTMKNLGISESVPLIPAISRYRDSLDTVKGNLNEAERVRTTSKQLVVAAEEAKQQLDGAYRQSVKELNENLEKERTDHRQTQEENSTNVGDLDTHLQKVRIQTTAANAQLRSELAQRDEQIRQLKARVEQLVRFTQKSDGATGEIEADGQVVTIDRDNDLVYINLTQADRVPPGLTFEVFKQNDIIRVDESQEVRGVATIEVIRSTETSSVARIVRLDPRASLTSGDQIVNIAYDRSATYEFVVHGTFDINNIGAATMADNRRVQGMIERWGGKVVDELTYQTDYLVLGLPPQRPEALPDDATVVQIEINEAKKRIWAQYRALANDAEKLKIPILNQNRFLRLIGYYRR